MRNNSQDKGPVKHAFLLGVGLDNKDGHKRMTQAEEFAIVGGSQETHEKMTETLIKTCEEIRRKGKVLADVDKQELSELIDKHRPD